MINFDAIRHFVSFLARGGERAGKLTRGRSPHGWSELEEQVLEAYDAIVAIIRERQHRVPPRAWAFVLAALASQLKKEEKWPARETSES